MTLDRSTNDLAGTAQPARRVATPPAEPRASSAPSSLRLPMPPGSRPPGAYIHNNPVRRGLVHRPEDWPWCSAGWYAGLEDVKLAMDDCPPEPEPS